MSKLYFCKCANFLLFLSLSTFFIHHFHSYAKILTMISLISTLIPCIPTLIPRIPNLIPCIPTLIPRIPLIPFPDSPFRLLQIALTVKCSIDPKKKNWNLNVWCDVIQEEKEKEKKRTESIAFFCDDKMYDVTLIRKKKTKEKNRFV